MLIHAFGFTEHLHLMDQKHLSLSIYI